jgi:hypothetical protein
VSEFDNLPLFAGMANPMGCRACGQEFTSSRNASIHVCRPTLDPMVHAQRREEAIERVDDNADPLWSLRAKEAVQEAARRHSEFTSDEVWEILDERGVIRPVTPAAIGPIMRKAAAACLIRNTNRIRESKQTTNHRKVTIWETLP